MQIEYSTLTTIVEILFPLLLLRSRDDRIAPVMINSYATISH